MVARTYGGGGDGSGGKGGGGDGGGSDGGGGDGGGSDGGGGGGKGSVCELSTRPAHRPLLYSRSLHTGSFGRRKSRFIDKVTRR